MARGNNLIDEGGPVVRPFLLQNGDKNEIELVQQRALRLDLLFGFGVFENESHNKIADTYEERS